MKLLLTSEGFSTPEIVEAAVRLVGKPQGEISFAVINEAHAVESGDKRWVLDELNRVANLFRGAMDLVNLLALSPQETVARISQRDAIFVVGGHTDYLMHVFNKTGFSKSLPTLLEEKVYVGSSAGSMVLGHRISSEAYQRVYAEKGTYGIENYLELVHIAMKPHLDSQSFPLNRADVLREVSESFEGRIHALRDDAAMVVDGDTMNFIGSPPLIVERGQISHG